jgi:hypothetical protein
MWWHWWLLCWWLGKMIVSDKRDSWDQVLLEFTEIVLKC